MPISTMTPETGIAVAAPTGSPFLVTIYGLVKTSDATPASGVCVRTTTATPDCYVLTAPDGTYRFSMPGRLNQTITVVLTRQDGAVLWKATATITIKGATVQVPDVKLAK